MKEITFYLADDDTVFNDSFDCQEYELGLLIDKYKKSLRFYGGDKTRILNDEAILDGNEIFFVEIDDEKSLNTLQKIQEWNGMFGEINSVGKWEFVVEDDSDWNCLEYWKKINEGE